LRISRCEWDEENVGHLAKHQVEPEEAEEVLVSHPYIRRTRVGRYLAYGTTIGGRYLTVIFLYKGGGVARVITAREMSRRERRLYKEKGRRG
jgi:uncharacterized DUF497 family protein